jgi:hypothetical protein
VSPSDDALVLDRPLTFGDVLDQVDRRVGRPEASDAELLVGQAFAVAWAAVGYALWLAILWTARGVAVIGRLLARPFRRRRDDGEWTTTMKRRGRPL